MLIELTPTSGKPANTTPAPPQSVKQTTGELSEQELFNGQSDQDFVDDAMESFYNDPEFNLLYRDAKNVRDRLTLRQINAKHVNFMRNMLSEYLGSFVLFGYDLNGRRVLVQNTTRQGDADSLQKYLEIVANSNVLYSNQQAANQTAMDDDGDDDDGDDDDE